MVNQTVLAQNFRRAAFDRPGDFRIGKSAANRGERGQRVDDIADAAQFDYENFHRLSIINLESRDSESNEMIIENKTMGEKIKSGKFKGKCFILVIPGIHSMPPTSCRYETIET